MPQQSVTFQAAHPSGAPRDISDKGEVEGWVSLTFGPSQRQPNRPAVYEDDAGLLFDLRLTSMLLPQNNLLLMVGFPDPNQAALAATNFIVNIKGLASGTAVAVTGIPTQVGTQPAVIMSDTNASGGLEQHAGTNALDFVAKAPSQSIPKKKSKKTDA